MRSSLDLTTLFATAATISYSRAQTCYRADNLQAVNGNWTACRTDTPFSMCWRSGRLQGPNGAPAAGCAANGLELASDGSGTYWRSSCTDPTWKSPYCLTALQGCKGGPNGGAEVTPCDGDGTKSTKWCCGHQNTACCNSNPLVIALVMGDDIPVSTTSSSTSPPTSSPTSSPPSSSDLSSASSDASSPTSAASSTLSSWTLLTTSPASSPSNSAPGSSASQTTNSTTSSNSTKSATQTAQTTLTAGAKAGIGISAAALAIGGLLLGLWIWRRPRTQSARSPSVYSDRAFIQQDAKPKWAGRLPSQPQHNTEQPHAELGDEVPRVEMNGQREIYELFSPMDDKGGTAAITRKSH